MTKRTCRERKVFGCRRRGGVGERRAVAKSLPDGYVGWRQGTNEGVRASCDLHAPAHGIVVTVRAERYLPALSDASRRPSIPLSIPKRDEDSPSATEGLSVRCCYRCVQSGGGGGFADESLRWCRSCRPRRKGEFSEIDPPARLVYTFRWDPDPDDRETVVTLSLVDRGESTQLTVHHTGFATDARRALHQQGWTQTLDGLKGVLGR